jgi:hypothetical protein
MPTWGELLTEISQMGNAYANQAALSIDIVRKKYLSQLFGHSKRNIIVYASKWTISPTPRNEEMITINEEDIEGLMEVIHQLDGDLGLDLIVHSPGGSPVAAEAMVQYLRKKFSSIRVIIPQAAMSAATMIACSADEIIMGKHSFIGPIDPQMIVPVPTGLTATWRMIPAQAIEDQFEMAKEQCKDAGNLASWYPILPMYGPALLKECEIAKKLSKKLVKEWLVKYMFASDSNRTAKAERIASFLLSHKTHLSHGRHIDRETARSKGLKIIDLEADPKFQDLVLSVFHATSLTFQNTGAVKIIENQIGKAYIKQEIPPRQK